jgi:hypothetical protein
LPVGGGFSSLALAVVIGAAALAVGVAFAPPELEEDVVPSSIGTSGGFSPPEHPAKPIVKQTKNIVRMGQAYQKW